MSECKWYFCCPLKRYYEDGKLEKYWIINYCMNNWNDCVRYKMEEKGEYHPDCMLPDGSVNIKLL